MSLQRFNDYREALDKLSKAAQLEFEDLWLRLDQSSPKAVRDALMAIMAALVEKYGGMAALAAAEYYEGERTEALGGDYRSLLAETAPTDEIEKDVRYACGHLFR